MLSYVLFGSTGIAKIIFHVSSNHWMCISYKIHTLHSVELFLPLTFYVKSTFSTFRVPEKAILTILESVKYYL